MRPTTDEVVRCLRLAFATTGSTRNHDCFARAVLIVEQHDKLVAALRACWDIAYHYDPEESYPALPDEVSLLLAEEDAR